MKNYILKNARVIDPGRNIDSVGDIGVCGKLIEEPAKLKDPEVIDLKGKVLSPGFIDLHVFRQQRI